MVDAKFIIFMKKYIVLLLLACLVSTSFTTVTSPSRSKVRAYIEKYKQIAVLEMQRTNIPASIILAQGIIESQYGNSRLARQGHNHFGLKCRSTWKGKTILASDDAPNECFRKYDNAYQSFIDHSFMITHNKRYNSLFKLKSNNYKGWAKGLLKAGYATNAKYADLLVTLIKQYELQKFDEALGNEIATPAVYAQALKRIQPIYEPNVPMQFTYIVNKGDTLHGIAKQFGTSANTIKIENKLLNDALKEGQKLKVMLQK